MTDRTRSLLRYSFVGVILLIGLLWGWFVPCAAGYALGIALLALIAAMPRFDRGDDANGETGKKRSDGGNRKFTRLMIILSCIFFFVSSGSSLLLQFASEENDLVYDSYQIRLDDPELQEYSRQVRRAPDGFHVEGAACKAMLVRGDGKLLKDAADYKAWLESEGRDSYFRLHGTLIVSPQFRTLQVTAVRPVILWAASPEWVFGWFVLLALYHGFQRDCFRRKYRLCGQSGRWLAWMLGAGSVLILLHEVPELEPVKFAVDGPHYLSFAYQNLWESTILSYRTPGYPALLRLMMYVSPVSYHFIVVLQYAFFLGALSWLLYELHRFKMPTAVCIGLFAWFHKYMQSFHHFVLADSPGLSGLILLLAASVWLYRVFDKNRDSWWKWGAAALVGVLCMAQLMIKPFPGTILVPGGMIFLMMIRKGLWRKAFGYGIAVAAICAVLPVLFCAYRYVRCGDFNFASLASFQMMSTTLVLVPEKVLDSGKVSPETVTAVRSIIEETRKANPALVWPPPLQSADFRNRDFENYANKLMYHPGLRNGSWLKNRDMSAYPSFDVGLELECKKLLRELIRHVPMNNFHALQRTYLNDLRDYLAYPRLTSHQFSERSPFGSSWRMFFWLFLPLSAALAVGKYVPRAGRLPWKLGFLLLCVLFLGAAATISTFVLVTPFIEVRREMIGLFSVFFGTWALIGTVWYELIHSLVAAWGRRN